MSLDGYIAGPNGEADWITPDPEFDFTALYREFDTILVGRRTFELMVAAQRTSIPGMKTVVFSRTLRQQDHPDLVLVAENYAKFVRDLKAGHGKDIWLFGGGSLFSSLVADRLVDTVEARIAPILLGAGISLLPDLDKRVKLSLTAHTISKTGIVSLKYAIT
jgi:dihydrofolate reductase